MSLKQMIERSNLTTTQKKLFKSMTANQMNVIVHSPKTDTESVTDPNLVGARVVYLVHIDGTGIAKTVGKNINYDAEEGKVTYLVKAEEFLFIHYTS